MRVPRGLSGAQFIRALARIGYATTRQEGSHVRLTCEEYGLHHITVPLHDSLHVRTLSRLLSAIARHHGIAKDELLRRLFG